VPAAATSSRSDARRNRERIVAAALALFTTRGVDVSVRDIARQAEVGLGTMYRHFPSRDDLVDAALTEAFADCIVIGEEALEAESAWEGLVTFLERTLRLHAGNRGFIDVVETQERGRERSRALRARIRSQLAELIARAQAEGTLRPDFTPQDGTLIFWACDRTIELAGDVAPTAWRRQLAFILDGLRTERATPVDEPPLTERQLAKVRLH
jgi:AcrR family transcriptional regulator